MNTFSVSILFIISFSSGSTKFCGLTVLPTFFAISYYTHLASSKPDILYDPEYGQHGFLQLKEVRLHFVENGDRSKPLMLFLHGFPDFWFSWRKQLVHFAKTHWTVAIDMRGYGTSEKPSGIKAYDISHLHNDVIQVIWALGRRNCILVAHDWGGAIAWTVAAHHPKIIRKLIIIDGPHPNVYLDLIYRSPIQFIKSQYLFYFQLRYVPEATLFKIKSLLFKRLYGSFSTQKEINAYEDNFPTIDSWNAPLNYYRNIFKANFSAVLPKVQAPTLVIWGENDIFLDVTMPAQFKPHVRNLRVRIISNAGHFVQAEKPREVNRLMEEFLSGVI